LLFGAVEGRAMSRDLGAARSGGLKSGRGGNMEERGERGERKGPGSGMSRDLDGCQIAGPPGIAGAQKLALSRPFE
jgi:hypothetical protein